MRGERGDGRYQNSGTVCRKRTYSGMDTRPSRVVALTAMDAKTELLPLSPAIMAICVMEGMAEKIKNICFVSLGMGRGIHSSRVSSGARISRIPMTRSTSRERKLRPRLELRTMLPIYSMARGVAVCERLFMGASSQGGNWMPAATTRTPRRNPTKGGRKQLF